jgi:beta-lactamase class A
MPRAVFFAVLMLCSGLAMVGNVSAAGGPMSESDAIRIVLTAKPVPADIFAQSFLAQVPASQITTIRDQVIAPLGAFVNSEGSNGQYVAHFTKGTVKVLIHLDAQDKIDGLLLREPTVTGGSVSDALEAFNALPGTVSYLVIEDGKDREAHNADRALGVGSAFKLAVLNALRKQIDARQRHWSDVVRLQNAWKSLPSGVLQTWPDGSPLTLSTLATEMISISDNTAADALIHVAGQQALAPFGATNVPFLTTRQTFLLKTKGDEALRERFRSGGVAERRAVVSELEKKPLPELAQLDTSPALSDIEWHFSNRQLCKLMEGVHDLPLMSVNPGLASPTQWKNVAYKGGSDWGVLNLTTWLEAKNGKRYCVSATWNDSAAPLDETKFETAYRALLGALASQ